MTARRPRSHAAARTAGARFERQVADEQLLYTPVQVADALGLSRAKTYGLLRDGELPSIKIGRSRRVTRDDLQAFIESHRAEDWTPVENS